jgi:hypothetical protein
VVVPIEIKVLEAQQAVETETAVEIGAVESLKNTLPEFESKLEPVLDVEVVIEASGEIREPV